MFSSTSGPWRAPRDRRNAAAACLWAWRGQRRAPARPRADGQPGSEIGAPILRSPDRESLSLSPSYKPSRRLIFRLAARSTRCRPPDRDRTSRDYLQKIGKCFSKKSCAVRSARLWRKQSRKGGDKNQTRRGLRRAGAFATVAIPWWATRFWSGLGQTMPTGRYGPTNDEPRAANGPHPSLQNFT
jgi:hypothetical protein